MVWRNQLELDKLAACLQLHIRLTDNEVRGHLSLSPSTSGINNKQKCRWKERLTATCLCVFVADMITFIMLLVVVLLILNFIDLLKQSHSLPLSNCQYSAAKVLVLTTTITTPTKFPSFPIPINQPASISVFHLPACLLTFLFLNSYISELVALSCPSRGSVSDFH